jgi:hypothetical protein
MPIGSRSRLGSEPRMGSASLHTDKALDGLVARFLSSPRLRVWASVAVVVLLVAGCASGSTAPQGTSAGATTTALVTASATAPSSASVPTPTLADSASPVASGTDTDDETSSSAGASFAPNATGVLTSTSGTVPADRLPGEPDPILTPGALNPAVTQATIGSTICVSGWTATIRPSSSFTTALKIKQIVQYGYSDTMTSSYEEDHLISLELGGAPADPRNLWPEPYTVTLADGRSTGAHTKDGFETKLKSDVCAGTITLAQGQSEIGDQWVHAYYGVALVASPTNPATTAAPTANVTSPPVPPVATAPTPTDPYAAAKAAGATAICADGSLSFSKTRSGTCSKNGGVHWWTGNVGAAGPGAH